MKIKGKIKPDSIAVNYVDGCLLFTVEVAKSETAIFEGSISHLLDKEVDIDISKHREKRSLNANGYFWVMCDKVAEAVGCSKQEIHDKALADYGTFDIIDGQIPMVQMHKNIPPQMLGGTWMCIESDGDLVTWGKLKSTSEMNTKEFSTVINGIVSEAKLLGIETIPPEELKRLLAEVEK